MTGAVSTAPAFLFSSRSFSAISRYSACSWSGRSPFLGADIRAASAAIRISRAETASRSSSADVSLRDAFFISPSVPSKETSFRRSKRTIRVAVFRTNSSSWLTKRIVPP